MKRLHGADGFHLYLETRTEHHHTIKVVVVDPSTAHDRLDLQNTRNALDQGLAYVPPLHWQLVPMPLRISHPLWAYRRDLDLDYHLRRAAVPAPGGRREFAEVVSEIASTGLERDRPLWQLWIVEGLAGGRIAYVMKVHHALADGVSSARILMDGLQSSPDASPPDVPHPFEADEPIPPPHRVLSIGLRDALRISLAVPGLLFRLVRLGFITLGRRLRRMPRAVKLFAAPATRLNRKLTPHRWFATVDLPLEDLKRVKNLLGGSLNDVYVAVCAGAIRGYLESRGELPKRPLVASIPVSTRKPEEIRAYGNRVSTWLVSLATHCADPLERYEAVRASLSAARATHETGDPDLIPDFMEAWWLYQLVMGMAQRVLEWITGRPGMHVIVSNVRGPESPLYLNGAALVGLQSMGPLIDGVGLNFTGWSYLDTLHLGIVACREHVPDLWDLADAIPGELAELLAAAEKATPST